MKWKICLEKRNIFVKLYLKYKLNGYIKQKGKNRLISVNRKYKDIFIGEYDNIYCAGKVVGKLDDDEIAN